MNKTIVGSKSSKNDDEQGDLFKRMKRDVFAMAGKMDARRLGFLKDD